MALIHDIQEALLDDSVGVGSTLLKLRYLAAKLGSHPLEDWVRHETEGYPRDIEVPPYRVTEISYSGTFSNGYQTLNRVSVPQYIIEKHAGEAWVRFSIRDSLSVIDASLSQANDTSEFTLDCSNVKVLIQDKVYDNVPCIELNAHVPKTAFSRIQSTVRAKVLDLTLELERHVPAASEIVVGRGAPELRDRETAQVSQITNQIFFGNVTNIDQGSGTVSINVIEGDRSTLLRSIESSGIPEADAKQLAEIIAGDKPDAESLGRRVRDWISEKSKQGAVEAWGIAKPVLVDIAKEASRQFWGL